MTWHEGTIYAFDCESTGVSVHHDRIVTATVVKLVPNAEPEARTWLINPGVEIPEAATAVHGITTEHAREHGVDPGIAVAEIAATVTGVLRARLPLVAFNAAFDLSMLDSELGRHGLPRLEDHLTDANQWHYVIDPFVLGKGIDTRDRVFIKGRKHKLPDLCDRYKVPFTESHDATADAIGAGRLARAIGQRDMVGGLEPSRLFQVQRTWRREMQHSLRTYFDKNGIEHDGCDGGWPLQNSITQPQAVDA